MENAAGHLDVLLAALGDETDADLSTRGACAAPLATNHELEALRRWNESSARHALVADDAMTLPVVLAMNAAMVPLGSDEFLAQRGEVASAWQIYQAAGSAVIWKSGAAYNCMDAPLLCTHLATS